MGANDSKPVRTTKQQRTDREELKKNVIHQRKNDIEKVQQQVLSGNNKALIPVKDITTMLQIGETAKTQLDRGGSALTKSDLVAVIVALDPTMRQKLSQLNQLTITDLNVMIRSIIYDPSRIFTVENNNKPLKSNQTMLIQ